ncbi:hypothetical protein RB557 [Rhodopirellula baltica SH 1]|uniref:Uncharacterized protein n=1 Tax=Rhodopirellula baltica (strain DSM 10527 / NCIMB 13988 / SH1) TaxID=243090 RepID=Q7UYJ2_RHOBA|nr:hypothetical protein RB557 [Rhodopirellula baltica SH 1]
MIAHAEAYDCIGRLGDRHGSLAQFKKVRLGGGPPSYRFRHSTTCSTAVTAVKS